MQAIILAGGYGTRLKNVIFDIPKPMAPINKVPFLTYLFKQLERNGFTKIVLAVGYLHNIIINYYGNRFNNIDIEYSIEDEPLGTGGCILKALEKIDEKYFFVINGDTFFDIDFSKLIKPINILMVCKKMQNTSRYGRILINNGIIGEFTEKGIKESGYINGGIYYINREVFQKFELPQKFSLEIEFFKKYLSQLQIQVYLSDNYFIDIGIPDDFDKAQRDFL